MSKKNIIFLLILTIALGAFLRLYNLGNTNLGFFRDEAALGFNAWSLLTTGADEYGQKFPVIFRSFEVFFMPAYVYLSVPIFWVFGISEFSTRLLSALSGIGIIYLSFLIANKIFKSKTVGLVSAFVVATSPWAIFYSRGAFEGNLALLFFACGVYLWLKFKQTNKIRWFFASIIVFVFSMYSYQAPRPVTPLFVGFSILVQRQWWKAWRLWVVGGLVAIILYLPVVKLTTQAAGYHRAVGVSIFSSEQAVPGLNPDKGEWQKLYLVPREFLSLYVHYFSPANIFWQGDYNTQRRLPNISVLYFWQLPFLIYGVWKVWKSDLTNKKMLFIWVLLAPIPASLTRDPFHTYRSILLWLPISLLIALGIYHALANLKKVKNQAIYLYIGTTAISLAMFMFGLLKYAPVYYWRDWDYGYKQIADYLKTQPDDSRVVIDDPHTESYINLLFYQVVPISEYQNAALEMVNSKAYYQNTAELRPRKVGRFEFRQVDWPSERGDENTIFIFPSDRLYPSEFSADPKLKLEKIVISPTGEAAFYIISTKKI